MLESYNLKKKRGNGRLISNPKFECEFNLKFDIFKQFLLKQFLLFSTISNSSVQFRFRFFCISAHARMFLFIYFFFSFSTFPENDCPLSGHSSKWIFQFQQMCKIWMWRVMDALNPFHCELQKLKIGSNAERKHFSMQEHERRDVVCAHEILLL